jgi:hypothetical protein
VIRGAALTDRVTLFNDSLVVSGESVFGDPEYEPEEGVEIPAFVDPIDATEEEVNRNTRLNRYRVTVEPDRPIDGLTEVEWNGRRYSVQGEPRLFSSRRGAHHYEIEIRAVTE